MIDIVAQHNLIKMETLQRKKRSWIIKKVTFEFPVEETPLDRRGFLLVWFLYLTYVSQVSRAKFGYLATSVVVRPTPTEANIRQTKDKTKTRPRHLEFNTKTRARLHISN